MTKQTWLSLVVGAALTATAGTAAPRAAPPQATKTGAKTKGKIAEQADEQLRRMSDYLAGLQTFKVHVTATDEVVLDTGQKLEFVSESVVSVKRPNMMRSDRTGPVADMEFRYNGKEISLYGKKTKYFATAAAPPTIDAMIDTVRTQYGLEAPAADLLFSKPYDVLTEDVVSGTYLGLEPLGEEQAHHLAFRGNEVDWQIWIKDGAEPLPLRYVITSKKEKAQPEFTAELARWETHPKLSDDDFTLTPPEGATRIKFLERGKRPGQHPRLEKK